MYEPRSLFHKSLFFGWIAAFAVSATSFANAFEEPIPEKIEFNRDVRPILSDRCFACHGPDKNKREADLRLDQETAVFGTEAEPGPVIPHKVNESELIKRILATDDQQMPPAAFNKPLEKRDIEILKRWIEQGASWEGHWAFQPIKAPVVPEGQSELSIDAFVNSQLARLGKSFSPEADRVTLIRRLSFDLTGLPPTPEEVAEFVADQSPQAYENLVDRLLASPRFGERMAMWWLDLVRYADSVGYHGDQAMSVHPFREYVIRSFNANKPFDQFTREQLAGDLMPSPTLDQRIASGYNRLGMMSAEGGVQPKEYLAKYIAERVRNVSGTWLGITMGCCECHDHKYDPLTMKDFYSMEAFFADIQEVGLYAGAHETGEWGPSIKVPSDVQRLEQERLNKLFVDLKAKLDANTPELEAAQAEWEKSTVPWQIVKPMTITSQHGTELKLQDDGAVLATGTSPDRETYTLQFPALGQGITAFRVEVLPDDSFPQKGPGRAGNGNFVLSEFVVVKKKADGSGEEIIPLQNASATYEQTGAAGGNPYGKWAVAAAIDKDEKGPTWGWAIMEQVGRPQAAVFETAADLACGEGEVIEVRLLQNLDNPKHTIGKFRLSVTTAKRPLKADTLPLPIEQILAKDAASRSDEEKKTLAAHFRAIAPQLQPLRDEKVKLEAELVKLEKSIPITLVTMSVQPRTVKMLNRGNWMDETGEERLPAFPAILPQTGARDGRMTRADLAEWIMASDNPLTARVFANRVWKLFFGVGISKKLDDLGGQGEWPSHPLLLDYLATRFRDLKWDVKGLIKEIVMSKTYRQSSFADEAMREFDPYNKWLARQGRFRLDAEMVRDNALAIGGLLIEQIGGPSVKPYQPRGYWAYLNFPTREWENGKGVDLYRRGLYTHWQRQYLHPSLLAFDAPSREECTADRPRSNTPLQSLVLLNDPTYIEAARSYAELTIRSGGADFESRLKFAYARALSRAPRENEVAVLKQVFESQLADYRADRAAAEALLKVGEKPAAADLDAAEVAAWTGICRTIFNLHETITRN